MKMNNERKNEFTQYFPKETLTVTMPYEMYSGKKLNSYWTKIKERADNFDKVSGDTNTWRDIVLGFHYYRNVQALFIDEAQDKVQEDYPWDNIEMNRLEEEKKELEEQQRYESDEEYRNKRDLEEIAFKAFKKPLAFINSDEYWLLDKHIPPQLNKTWEKYQAGNL